MGLAVSNMHKLMLTARQSDISYQLMMISNSRMTLAYKTETIANRHSDNITKIQAGINPTYQETETVAAGTSTSVSAADSLKIKFTKPKFTGTINIPTPSGYKLNMDDENLSDTTKALYTDWEGYCSGHSALLAQLKSYQYRNLGVDVNYDKANDTYSFSKNATTQQQLAALGQGGGWGGKYAHSVDYQNVTSASKIRDLAYGKNNNNSDGVLASLIAQNGSADGYAFGNSNDGGYWGSSYTEHIQTSNVLGYLVDILNKSMDKFQKFQASYNNDIQSISQDSTKLAEFKSGLTSADSANADPTTAALNGDTSSKMTEQQQEIALDLESADYQKDMNKINTQDKRYEMQQKNLETQLKACETQLEVIDKRIEKNMSGFKIFGS